MKAITTSNVIGAQQYREMVREVMEFAGKTVSRTLGPCANTSIIEEMGPLVASKDGFHAMKRIMFAPGDTFARNIMDVIVKISHRMVSLVGDGSSSAVVAAWKFAELLDSELAKGNNKFSRPRELNKLVQEAIDEITEVIQKNAIVPKDTEIPNVVYHTALVSTNGDEKFASMMKEIYEKCSNDVQFHVKLDKRKSEVSYQIVEGYKANQYYMIDPIFHNMENGFECKDCHVIAFDMAIDQYHYNMIHRLAALAHQIDDSDDPTNPKEVIIVAPSYNQHFLDKINQDVRMDLAAINSKSMKHFRIRYMRALAVNQYQRNEYMDFCAMVGSDPITATDFNEMVDIMESTENFNDERLERAIGGVGHLQTYKGDWTIIDGFHKCDKEKLKITMNHVKSMYDTMAAENLELPYPTTAFINTRQRYRKLLCKMVEISIGAENEYERSLVYDAADDATKAAESVVKYGYNIGGNLSIIFAANELVEKYSGENTDKSDVFHIIYRTFVRVLQEVIANKFGGDGFEALDKDAKEEVDTIIRQCFKEKKCYDLVEDKYTDDIINSCRTDIEILRGAISFSLTLLTANQYISTSPTYVVE